MIRRTQARREELLDYLAAWDPEEGVGQVLGVSAPRPVKHAGRAEPALRSEKQGQGREHSPAGSILPPPESAPTSGRVVVPYVGDRPWQKHPTDAGWDLHLTHDVNIPPGGALTLRFATRVSIPPGLRGDLWLRSSIKQRDISGHGVIDAGYTGTLRLRVVNHSPYVQRFGEGERVAQLVLSHVPPVAWEQVDRLPDTDRGEHGFGSTGKGEQDNE